MISLKSSLHQVKRYYRILKNHWHLATAALISLVVLVALLSAINTSPKKTLIVKTASTTQSHKASTPTIKKIAAAPVPAAASSPTPVTKSTPTYSKPPAGTVSTVTSAPGTGVGGLTPSSGSGSGSGTSNTGGTSNNNTPSSYTSSNWAGYMATTGNFTNVSGSWNVPVPTGYSYTSADASWIGIGGVSSNDLIQAGTVNTVLSNGQVLTSAFYEMLPSAAVAIPSLSVTPGDAMSASVSEISSGSWTIRVNDLTTGQSFSTGVSYASSNSSAEWIEEDPSYSHGGLVPFDNFGRVSFTNGFADNNGSTSDISLTHAASVKIVNGSGSTLATPSSINGDGDGFSVTRD